MAFEKINNYMKKSNDNCFYYMKNSPFRWGSFLIIQSFFLISLLISISVFMISLKINICFNFMNTTILGLLLLTSILFSNHLLYLILQNFNDKIEKKLFKIELLRKLNNFNVQYIKNCTQVWLLLLIVSVISIHYFIFNILPPGFLNLYFNFSYSNFLIYKNITLFLIGMFLPIYLLESVLFASAYFLTSLILLTAEKFINRNKPEFKEETNHE